MTYPEMIAQLSAMMKEIDDALDAIADDTDSPYTIADMNNLSDTQLCIRNATWRIEQHMETTANIVATMIVDPPVQNK